MKKTNVVGMVSLLGGISMWGWQMLEDFMGSSRKLSAKGGMSEIDKAGNMRFSDLMDEANFDFIDSISWQWLHDSLIYLVYAMDLWLILVIVGAFLLVVGGLFIKK
jgi:hypothetical protein